MKKIYNKITKKKKKLLNVNNELDTDKNYIWELHVKLTSTIISNIILLYKLT